MTSGALPVRVPGSRPRREFHLVLGPNRRRGRIRYWVLLAMTVTIAFLLLVYSRIALDRTAFVLEDIENRISVEEARYWDLRLQVTELQAPERIAQLASEMGMVYPDSVEEVVVPGLGSPGSAVEGRWVELKALLGAQP